MGDRFCCFVQIIGFCLLAVGVWAQLEKNPYSQLSHQISKFYLDPAWLLIIVGGVTFVLGFSGCIGALRENTCLLALYSTLLGVLLLTELAVAVLGFVSKDWVQGELEGRLDDMIVLYRDDPDLQTLIDSIQGEWVNNRRGVQKISMGICAFCSYFVAASVVLTIGTTTFTSSRQMFVQMGSTTQRLVECHIPVVNADRAELAVVASTTFSVVMAYA